MEKEIKLYNGKVIITFGERDWRGNKIHIFKDKDGNKIESVTSFTRVIDKPFLIPWAVKLTREFLIEKLNKGTKITEETILEAANQYNIKREAGADIGQAIHEWIAEWIAGKGKKRIEIPRDEKIRNGITAFMDFQDKHKVKWLESERIVYSKKHNYAGILDAVGKIGKDIVLIDFKSSNGLYPEFAFQAAGYQIAYEEETKKKLDYKIIVGFGKETGEFQIKEYRDGEDDKNAFLGCVYLKRRLDQLK